MNQQSSIPSVLVIYGNPKKGGFVHGCLDTIAMELEKSDVQLRKIHLMDKEINDCTGCFHCLRTGSCPIEDDMDEIMDLMRKADGYVVGASVRNGFFPALFKRFYERITYPMGFTRDLKNKYVLGIGAVGMAGGKKVLGNAITFKEFQTYITGYHFFRTRIPTRLTVGDVAPTLREAADSFRLALREKPELPFMRQLTGKLDDFVLKQFMFKRTLKTLMTM